MKQILQSFRTGATTLEIVPSPIASRGHVLIQTSRSLVSLGTERMLVEFGKMSLISKARQQPERVTQVLDKIKSDGLIPTLETVFSKLEQPLPLGYCNVGRIVSLGEGVSEFSIGDRVASNGPHAEYVNIPTNMVVKIPDKVSDEEAAFTVIGSIGLQGIRLCNPSFGESIVVTGLGLIGLLTAQMLLANGCRVIGIDIDAEKCELARKLGVITVNPSSGSNPVNSVMEYTDGVGADAVIITASAKSNDIICQSAQMSRKRGRIILVGVISLNINRADFYEKELTFQVSCSYGPGRYDDNYEYHGIDYPLPFVRWTERRNFDAVLRAIDSGQLKVKELITDIVDLDNFQKIYGNIGSTKSVATILKYTNSDPDETPHIVTLDARSFSGRKGVIGVIGAGNFAKMTLLPAMKRSGAEFMYIASSGGVSCTTLAKKYGFSYSTTDYNQILNDEKVDTVLITTRHNSHARLVIDSLEAGKHVFVEKPLALNRKELDQIIDSYKKHKTSNSSLTVGFNRRFSPHTQSIKIALGNTPGPININATMNAGFIPANLWVHDLLIGGGRIIGEACHYFDLCVYLTGSDIESVCMSALGDNPNDNTDNASILLKFKNGSNAVVNYFSNGAKSHSKERIEVYSRERVFIIDNFRTTDAYGAKGFKNLKTKIDKGHKSQFHEYINRIRQGGQPLIPVNELVNVTLAAFLSLESMKEKRWINVPRLSFD